MQMRSHAFLLLLAASSLLPAAAAPATVARLAALPDGATPMTAVHSGGTVAREGGMLAYQWPGLYCETRFEGRRLDFATGPGEVILHLRVDGAPVATLERPEPGAYRIDGLDDGPHEVRIEVATESQAGPNRFDGFFLPPGSRALPAPSRARRIEFIGDSHTVGYGNLSTQRECSEAQVWASTDNTRAFGPRVARHYDADYRVNAISGRGVVRNYGGGPGDTLPQAWPWRLFDHGTADTGGDGWQPQVVVIALGTNDFSTPLRPGERWPDRPALHADYQRSYVAFVRSLRSRYPGAHFVLWATDRAEGEIREQVERVVARLHEGGERAVSFLPVAGLDMGGCHWHPSLADHARIADALVRHLDALAVGWPRSPHPTAQDDGSVQRDASPHGRRWRNSTRYTPAVHASPAAQPASTSDG